MMCQRMQSKSISLLLLLRAEINPPFALIALAWFVQEHQKESASTAFFRAIP